MRRAFPLPKLVAVLLVAVAGAGCRTARDAMPKAALGLWVYCRGNLADPGDVAGLEALWVRAARAGYRHVMLADEKFARLDEMDDGYRANALRLRRRAAELGLEIVPAVFPVGRSGSLLASAPDLAEGVPVRDARFVVRNGIARVVTDPDVRFGTRPDLVDPGVEVAPGLIRMHPGRGPRRAWFRVSLRPRRAYHLSIEVRATGGAGEAGSPRIQIRSDSRPLHWSRSLPEAGPEWKRLDLGFNSLERTSATVILSVQGLRSGVLEWRGGRLEEAGPVNVLRRAATPFVIAGRVEGRDFEPVRDERLGRSPWPGQFDEWHEPPVVRTSLPEGTELRASWTHAAVVRGGQVTCCIAEPEAIERLQAQARRVRELWEPRGCLMQYDEIRAMNRDASCLARAASPGALLAANVRSCTRSLGDVVPYVWSDMFDPFHNAVRDYELVRGDLAGSWEGLGPSVVIVNWNAPHARESLRFFARRGHRQILAAYYDGGVESAREWLADAAGVPGVIGIMYTTWRGDYRDLEAFARACASR